MAALNKERSQASSCRIVCSTMARTDQGKSLCQAGSAPDTIHVSSCCANTPRRIRSRMRSTMSSGLPSVMLEIASTKDAEN